MKRLLFLMTAPLVLLIHSCHMDEETIRFVLINNTSINVDFLFPVKYTNDVPFQWGTMYDLEPNDTTASSAWQAHFSWIHLLPNSDYSCDTGFNSVEIMSPYDTVRIFIFNGSYHYLSPTDNNPNQVFESETYLLCRYDLTSDNLLSLMDSEGIINIPFPPSDKMSKVKMFPHYTDVCRLYNK